MTKIINGKDLVNMQFIETKDGLLKRYEKKGKFVPKVNQKYWFVGADGSIDNFIHNNDIYDKWCLKHNIVFETEEECEEYKNYLIALDKYSYDFSDEEWEGYIGKYALYFGTVDKKINKVYWSNYKYTATYFKSIEDVQAFIDEVGEETIERYMFGYYR